MVYNILYAALLTILIETIFLAVMGYRDRLFLSVCILINFVTNVLLNCTLMLIPIEAGRLLQYPFEVAIVFIEWGVLKLLTKNKWRLLFFVFLANFISYSAGLLFYGSI